MSQVIKILKAITVGTLMTRKENPANSVTPVGIKIANNQNDNNASATISIMKYWFNTSKITTQTWSVLKLFQIIPICVLLAFIMFYICFFNASSGKDYTNNMQ